jgi:hypothetical protein
MEKRSTWHWSLIVMGALCACDDSNAAADGGNVDAAVVSDAAADATTDADAMIDASQAKPDTGTDSAIDNAIDGATHSATDSATDEDAGNTDSGTPPEPPYPPTLAATGLYTDATHTTLSPSVQSYEPTYELWSDGAVKKRYLYLPPNTTIDTSDMDRWQFPVGTKAWKEFVRDGVRVETRLLEKRADGWLMLAYAWNAAQTEAVPAVGGAKNVLGTQHDIPGAYRCPDCHNGQSDRLLGVSAIQLSNSNPGLNLTALTSADKLSVAPSGDYALPGTASEQLALGTLHANCGHCHNPSGIAWDRTQMRLMLMTGELSSVAATGTYTTRIVTAQPDASGLLKRMEVPRTNLQAMPPLANEVLNQAGADAVRTWISGM